MTSMLTVRPVAVSRGTVHRLESTTMRTIRIVGFDSAWIGEPPTVESMLVGNIFVLSSDVSDGKYRLDDLNKMLTVIRPLVPAAIPISLSLRFDSHTRSWIKRNREFRCWWIVEEMS